MQKKIEDKALFRVLDANYNRLKEALRVCEDICRFAIDEAALTRRFKDIRHNITVSLQRLNIKNLILARDIIGDVGRSTSGSELKRKNAAGIFFANIQRAKESLRVLEEFTKLVSPKESRAFKRMRYQLYELEKRVASKI